MLKKLSPFYSDCYGYCRFNRWVFISFLHAWCFLNCAGRETVEVDDDVAEFDLVECDDDVAEFVLVECDDEVAEFVLAA
uniref:Uncharacterized protein n=1 Tax=Meloidogyne floridensis TaxID=298350 RepID=A0A915P6N5_9BILA